MNDVCLSPPCLQLLHLIGLLLSHLLGWLIGLPEASSVRDLHRKMLQVQTSLQIAGECDVDRGMTLLVHVLPRSSRTLTDRLPLTDKTPER